MSAKESWVRHWEPVGRGTTYEEIFCIEIKERNGGLKLRGGTWRDTRPGKVSFCSRRVQSWVRFLVWWISGVCSPKNPRCCCEKKSFPSEPWGCWEEPAAPTGCRHRQAAALSDATSGLPFQSRVQRVPTPPANSTKTFVFVLPLKQRAFFFLSYTKLLVLIWYFLTNKQTK